MPLEGFRRAELKDHLRKWSWLYILGAVLLFFFNRMAFDVTRPRIPDENVLLVYAVGVDTGDAALAGLEADMLSRVQAAAPGIQAVEIVSLPYAGDGQTAADMLLSARLTAGDADAFICSPAAYERLLAMGACLALDDMLASGWMQGFTPVTAQDVQTGLECTQALLMPDEHALAAALSPGEKYLIVAANSPSLEGSLTNLIAIGALFAAE